MQQAVHPLGMHPCVVRIILILAVAIMIGPSLAFGSPACMTESEALANSGATFGRTAPPICSSLSFRQGQGFPPNRCESVQEVNAQVA
jgi:hypothetical protein